MKTVKVRIAVAIDSKGNWNACGWPDQKDKGEMAGIALDSLPGDPYEVVHWVEADVPIPESLTVQGAVVGRVEETP